MLSLRVGLLFCAFSLAFGLPARAVLGADPRPHAVDYAFVEALEQRIAKLLPSLLSSLAAARREREPTLVRCFDRALAQLHGVERQLAYHAERLEVPLASERDRHQKALFVLEARVRELAQSGISCLTDGALTRANQTEVEVIPSGP